MQKLQWRLRALPTGQNHSKAQSSRYNTIKTVSYGAINAKSCARGSAAWKGSYKSVQAARAASSELTSAALNFRLRVPRMHKIVDLRSAKLSLTRSQPHTRDKCILCFLLIISAKHLRTCWLLGAMPPAHVKTRRKKSLCSTFLTRSPYSRSLIFSALI